MSQAGLTGARARVCAAQSKAVMSVAATDRPRKRLAELMATLHDPHDAPSTPPPPPPGAPTDVCVQFQRVPLGFVGGGGEGGERLRAVRLQATALEGAPDARQSATPVAGTEYEVPCGLALRAVGYRSSPLAGAPFDAAKGIVPSADGGRVSSADGGADGAALYVTGWLKRGPNGVILTNVGDAQETANSLLADLASGALAPAGRPCEGGAAVRAALASQPAPLIGWGQWERLNAIEVERGAAAGKVREKLVDVSEMLELAGPA